MERKIDAVLPLLAALLVLFSNMWTSEMSFTISLILLLLLSAYYFFKPRK
ncbi:hypothetical protein HY969_02735 [Candidatus Kaiserbacteria bacterium]|nr:hypothetical protein [Candidatus Kaiserbacteria bacterium]